MAERKKNEGRPLLQLACWNVKIILIIYKM